MEEDSPCPWWNISYLHHQSLSSSSNIVGVIPTRNIGKSSCWVAASWTAPYILCVLSGSALPCRRSIKHFFCLCFESTHYLLPLPSVTRALSAGPCWWAFIFAAHFFIWTAYDLQGHQSDWQCLSESSRELKGISILPPDDQKLVFPPYWAWLISAGLSTPPSFHKQFSG